MSSPNARFYDLLYRDIKDYDGEARQVAELIRGEAPQARSLLDVACGTGEHAHRLRALGFHVDGVDLDAGMVAAAQEKDTAGRYEVGDMTTLALGRRYDAIVCLFSSIGYVRTVDRLGATLVALAKHLDPGGVLVVEPWFQPGDLTDGYVMTVTGQDADTAVARMSHTGLADGCSILRFKYVVWTAGDFETFEEVHQLGLFTREEMEASFRAAGLDVRYEAEGLDKRGLYVGRKPATA